MEKPSQVLLAKCQVECHWTRRDGSRARFRQYGASKCGGGLRGLEGVSQKQGSKAKRGAVS
eukprot:s649_g36.t1